VQDFTALYASLFFSVLLGILYDKVKKGGTVPLRKLRIGATALILLMVVQYEAMNIWGSNMYQLQGELYASKVAKDEVLILNQKDIEPQTIFYAHRNIRYEMDTTGAYEFLRKTNRTKAVFLKSYTRGGGTAIEAEYHLNLDSLTH
jgi:hypothetical protein